MSNRSILKFNLRYFIATLLLFFTEVYIAVYVHDNFVRPYIGDLLVVILIYCFLRSFFRLSVMAAAIPALLFSYLIETLQYFDIVHILGLQNSTIARIVIGTSFAWGDILAYTAGIAIVILLETVLKKLK